MRSGRVAVVLCAAALSVGLTSCGVDSDPMTTPTATTTGTNDVTESSETTQDDDFTGTWVDPDGRGYLTFDGEGGITGSDACNGITTTYTVDGSSASVEPFPTTMMACGDGWSQWLLSVTTVEHRGDSLVVIGQDGEDVGTLVPGDVPENKPQ